MRGQDLNRSRSPPGRPADRSVRPVPYGALRAGASGFLLKDCERAEIVNCIRAVAAGDRLLAPELTRRLIEAYVRRRPPTNAIPPELANLTERELEITRLVAGGLSNVDIADRLVVSSGTVKTHVGHILQKARVRDRIQLVVLAYESGLVEPGGRDSPTDQRPSQNEEAGAGPTGRPNP